jgi:hypothetical protein
MAMAGGQAPPGVGSGNPPGVAGDPAGGGAMAGGQAPGAGSGMPTGGLPTGGTPAAGQAGESGGAGAPAAGSSGGPPPTPGEGTCLQGSGDYMGEGPYQVAMFDVDLPGGLGPFTVFHPTNLESDCPHPIAAWGNGTSVTGSRTYAAYHRHAASWGIVTIAAHDPNAGSMPFLEGGLDYLLAENENPQSMFFGKLSERAGVAGHSQGGFAATTATSHPNVQAEVCVQGGGFRVPQHVAFLCQTGVDDFVRSQCTSTYEGAAGPSFLLDHTMADHISTPTIGLTTSEAGMQYVRTSTAWYRCWLADDENACALFAGNTSAPVRGDASWATCGSRNL